MMLSFTDNLSEFFNLLNGAYIDLLQFMGFVSFWYEVFIVLSCESPRASSFNHHNNLGYICFWRKMVLSRNYF
jgi:hypothetical protein